MLWLLARRFAGDTRAAVAVSGLFFMTLSIAATALAVDAASLHLARRTAQGAVDLAAIAATADLVNADAAARATLEANGIEGIVDVVVTPGRYTPDPLIAPTARFVPGATPANAARVELSNTAPLYFARAFMAQDAYTIRTEAVAARSEFATFSIGSRLASLDGGIVNALLSGLLGGNVNLSVMDYNAIAGLNVDLLRFSRALGTTLGVTAGTYQQVLATNASVGQIVEALIAVARSDPDGTAAEVALTKLLNQSNVATLEITSGRLLDLGPYANLGLGESAAGGALNVSAYQLLQAAAQLANGDRQVDVDLGLAVPGLLGLNARIAIGEPPQGTSWIAVGDAGAEVYTAQTRIRIVAQVGGTGLLAGAAIRVPIYLDVAAARARLTSISCGANPQSDARANIAVRPSVAKLWIGEPANLAAFWNFDGVPAMNQALLADVAGLARIRGLASAQVTNLNDTPLTFTMQQVMQGQSQTASTIHPVQSLLASLIGDLDLNIQVLGIGLGFLLNPLLDLVAALLAPVGALLDPVLVSLLELLGVRIGEADVWVHGIRCDGAVLVG